MQSPYEGDSLSRAPDAHFHQRQSNGPVAAQNVRVDRVCQAQSLDKDRNSESMPLPASRPIHEISWNQQGSQRVEGFKASLRDTPNPGRRVL